MRALILAAGEGTRLRPLTLSCPKPMLPVAGLPLLAHTLKWLREQGIVEVAINLHHLPDVITNYVGDGNRFGMSVTYSRENPILGSAGAAKKLQNYLGSPFLVVYGDMLVDVDLAPLVRLHESRGARLTLGLMHVPDPTAAGIVSLRSDGTVLRFVEKPLPGEIDGNLGSAGIYLCDGSVLEAVPAECYYDFGHDLVPRLLRDGVPVAGCYLGGHLLDIGTPEAYSNAQELVKEWGLAL